jgi:hypothetical protein
MFTCQNSQCYSKLLSVNSNSHTSPPAGKISHVSLCDSYENGVIRVGASVELVGYIR